MPSRAAAALCLAALLPRGAGGQAASWAHSWETMGTQLWVDFGAREGALTPAQLAFLATTYSIISLEKCFNGQQFPGDSAAGAANASRGIRAAAAAAGVPPPKILFYFHSSQAFDGCFTSSAAFEAQPSWWLRNKTGGPIYAGQGHMYNFSVPAVRAHVAASSVAVPDAASLFDGVFADGTADTHVPTTAPGTPAEADYFAAHHASVAQTAAAVRASMRPGARLFGNGLAEYAGNPPDHGLGLLPFLDGLCFEHFLGFESLNQQTGQLAPGAFALAAALIANATAAGKPVLVRAWPGPVCAPITGLGPSWCGPDKADAPTTAGSYAAAADALRARLVPALAGYLIVANDITYFSYSWWYTDKDGMMPCYSAGACSFPEGWYADLTQPLGAPLADAALDAATGVYTRAFERARVSFNTTNMSASFITWLPASATPSAAPSAPSAPAQLAAAVGVGAAIGGTFAALALAAAAAAAFYAHRTSKGGGRSALWSATSAAPRVHARITSPRAIPAGERADSTRIMFNPVNMQQQ